MTTSSLDRDVGFSFPDSLRDEMEQDSGDGSSSMAVKKSFFVPQTPPGSFIFSVNQSSFTSVELTEENCSRNVFFTAEGAGKNV